MDYITVQERFLAEEAIRDVEKAYDHAWRTGDIDGLLACLATDAVLMNPYGEIARGQAEIRHELTEVLRTLGSDSKHTSVISQIEFVTDDVAVVDGEAFVQDAQGDGGTGSLHHQFTDVLVRRNREWLIAHIRAYRVFNRND
jgi:uncharacterized protein (TIGR02246 family)